MFVVGQVFRSELARVADPMVRWSLMAKVSPEFELLGYRHASGDLIGHLDLCDSWRA